MNGRRPLIAALALTLAACGGGSGPDAKTATVDWLKSFRDGQYGRNFDALVPEQQALFTRDGYVACASKAPVKLTSSTSFRPVETYRETITLPGTSTTAETTAVTVEIVTDAGAQRVTTHAMRLDGTWRIVLTDPTYYECDGAGS